MAQPMPVDAPVMTTDRMVFPPRAPASCRERCWGATPLVDRTRAGTLTEPVELECSLRRIWTQPKEAREALLQSLSALVSLTGVKRQDCLRRVPGQTDRL